MEVTNKLVQIADGVSMPMVGYGTFKPKEGEEQLLHESIVYAVVEWGYRHTAELNSIQFEYVNIHQYHFISSTILMICNKLNKLKYCHFYFCWDFF